MRVAGELEKDEDYDLQNVKRSTIHPSSETVHLSEVQNHFVKQMENFRMIANRSREAAILKKDGKAESYFAGMEQAYLRAIKTIKRRENL
jgi:hypothetical protein